MKYWVYLNGMQQGPYTFDQVKLLPIDATTPVWYEGLSQWTPAGQAPATAPLFSATQEGAVPPSHTSGIIEPEITGVPRRPPTYMVACILLTIFCCSPIALVGIVTAAMTSSRYESGEYAAAKTMSEVTEWLIIFSIIWALIGLPVIICLCGL